MQPLDWSIREASAADAESIAALLEHAGLDPAGVLCVSSRYWIALDQAGRTVGVVGLEYGAGAVLLRSAAVHTAWRKRGLGTALMERAMAEAAASGHNDVYLFSTDAGAYWSRQGFREVPVPELVSRLPQSFQVKHYEHLGWLPTEVAWLRRLTV